MADVASPVEQFTTGLAAAGARPERRGLLVIYWVEPVDGRFAGQAVPSGVEVVELERWPVVPPHWVHLPEIATFLTTNCQPSSEPGWLRHSRQIAGWGTERDSVQGWLAHIRSVLGDAQ